MADISFVDYSDETIKEWDSFVRNHDSTWIDSTSSWIDFFEKKLKYTNYSFLIYKEDKLIGIMPLFLVKSILFGTRLISGTILDKSGPFLKDDIKLVWPAIQQKLDSLARKHNVDFIELRVPPEKIPSYKIRSDYVDFHFNLEDKSVEDIWKSMDKKLRNGIRKAEKEIKTEISYSREDFIKLYRLYLETMKSLGTPPFGFNFFEKIWEDIEQKNSFMVLAKYNDKLINANLIVLFGYKAKYEMAVYEPKYRNLQANSLLVFESIKKCKELGYKTFIFGRTLKDSNVYTFKKRWNAIEIPSTYYYKLYKSKKIPSDLRETKMAILSKLWSFLPIFVTRIFGGYLRRKLGM
jgi:hypothetical protein